MAKITILILFLYVATITECVNWNRFQDDGIDDWVNFRPRYGHPQHEKVASLKTDDGNPNLVQIVRQYIQRNPHVKQLVSNLMSQLQQAIDAGIPSGAKSANTTWACPDPGPTICPAQPTEDTQTTVTTRTSLPQMWSNVVAQLEADPDNCQPCIDTWEPLQAAACEGLTWEQIANVLIPACELIFAAGDRDPVMCDGVISLNGPHIYCVLLESTPREVCESGNNCYPPDHRVRPPVSDRTPWAVKAALELEGTAPRAVKKSQKKPKRENLVMVAQLSDIHIQYLHSVGSPNDCKAYICCLEDSIGTGEARKYGEYQCNLPPHTMELFLNRVKDANPDFIIYAGDSPPHTQWDETMESQLNCSQMVADAMRNKFGNDKRVYTNIGNHEMYPTNLYSLRMPETKTMNARFTEMWHKLAGFDKTANNTMGAMAYYTTLVPGHNKLRILSMNTNYDWYPMNFYSTLNQYTPENDDHKEWVANTLTAARTAGEKVIIIGHHPVGNNIRSSRWWEEVAKNYSDVILLHVSGHTHSDEIKMSFDPDTMNATSVNHVAASTTSNTFVNPSMRVFYLDPVNHYQLVDIESFFLDIKTQEQSIGVPPAIAFSYSAKELYGLPDLSPNSWRDLVLRFLDDDELFLAYYHNRNSKSRPEQTCDYECKVSQICRLWFPEVSESEECRTLAPPEPPQPTTPGTGTTTTPPTLTASTLSHSSLIIVFLAVLAKLLLE